MSSTLPQISPPDWFPSKIISGGQTGADRAALDWALVRGIDHGGWCPKGRLACDGPLPPIYQLQETESPGYRQRTRRNVETADATLIFNLGELEGGTALTHSLAQKLGKPCHLYQLESLMAMALVDDLVEWLRAGHYATLNVAGPREEKRPGIYNAVIAMLDRVLI